jgi:hypothetical protein
LRRCWGAVEVVYDACIKPIADDLGCKHDDHDNDVPDFSGSIASSSVSILAFGASFFLGLAQQAL